jgi:hypothetical protein
MIAPLTYQNTMPMNLTSNSKISSGISRVFAAAVVNKQFCSMLLQDPQIALQEGYLGELFSLSREERELIISIEAKSLSDLAKQVNRTLISSY